MKFFSRDVRRFNPSRQAPLSIPPPEMPNILRIFLMAWNYIPLLTRGNLAPLKTPLQFGQEAVIPVPAAIVAVFRALEEFHA